MRVKEENDVLQNQVAYMNVDEDISPSEEESSYSDGKDKHDGLHVIPEDDAALHHVFAVKRCADGHPLPKNPRINGLDEMLIGNLPNPAPVEVQEKIQRKQAVCKKKPEETKKTKCIPSRLIFRTSMA